MNDDWQSRVRAERDELVAKLIKLTMFLGSGDARRLSVRQIELLYAQERLMRAYYEVLNERLVTE